jgi:hypothetical protein
LVRIPLMLVYFVNHECRCTENIRIMQMHIHFRVMPHICHLVLSRNGFLPTGQSKVLTCLLRDGQFDMGPTVTEYCLVDCVRDLLSGFSFQEWVLRGGTREQGRNRLNNHIEIRKLHRTRFTPAPKCTVGLDTLAPRQMCVMSFELRCEPSVLARGRHSQGPLPTGSSRAFLPRFKNQ